MSTNIVTQPSDPNTLKNPTNIDLGNCDREPIHQLGMVQSFGFLLAISSDWNIAHASLNVSRWLGHEASLLIGLPLLDCIPANAVHAIRNRLQSLRGGDSVERVSSLAMTEAGDRFDIAVYLASGMVIIEAEPGVSESDLNSGSLVRSMISRLHLTENFLSFCREGARQVRMLSGFDRIMIYKFNGDGSGEVIAEGVRGGFDSFLGLRYPASDIPKQARALYLRTWMRIISDVGSDPVPIIPQTSPTPLDLSLSALRSVSPIHIEYLKNMGVGASMSISIIVRGKLWGLIACHHLQPRYLSFERRIATELFGQIFSLLLESREREEEAEQEARGRQVQNNVMSAIANEGASLENMAHVIGDLKDVIRCDGVGIWLNGEWLVEGLTPTKEECLGVIRMLNKRQLTTAYATQTLAQDHPPAGDFPERAAGLLAIPISRTPRDYIVFFRRELARTVNWAGNPNKPVEHGPNGVRLTPRKSFDAWQEVVRGESEVWSDVDLRIAESLRMTLLDVVLRLTHEAESQRKTSNEKQELLIAELNHRVRNILGLVKGLLAQTSTSGSTEEFAEIVGGRVQALARAHDQITTDAWQPAPFKALIRAEGEAYLSGKNDRIRVDGEDILIVPQAFSTMALVIHELMTNSAKYGALCGRSGWVNIKWRHNVEGALVLEWQEQGGPPVRPPTRRGFGSTIIERSIPFDLKGEATLDYALDGLKATFVIPGDLVTLGKSGAYSHEPTIETASGDVAGFVGPMLMAEDNMIIALDAEDALHDIGVAQVITVSSVEDGLEYLANARPEAAVLDFNLGNETSIALAERLAEMGVPFFFATGYGEMLKLPEHFANRPVVKKPYNAEGLRGALAACLGR